MERAVLADVGFGPALSLIQQSPLFENDSAVLDPRLTHRPDHPKTPNSYRPLPPNTTYFFVGVRER